MKRYYFGKDFTIFYKYDLEAIPSADAPTIAIYSEKPSKDNAQACTGTYKLGSTITSWSNANTREATKTISIPAIVDPAPDSDTVEDEYYIAINYTLKASGQAQTVILPFFISRTIGQISAPEVDPADIKKLLPIIGDRLGDVELDDFIDIAVMQLKSELLKKGLRWEQVTNQSDLHLAILYKAASLAEHSEFDTVGDEHYKRYEDYNAMYATEISNLTIKVDTNQDGSPEVATKKSVHFLYNMK